MGKNFGPMVNPQEKILDPQTTNEEKLRIHEISTIKSFGPMKYPREKVLDPRNTHKKKFWTHKDTEFRTLRGRQD